MHSESIIEYIEHPDKLDTQTLPQVERLVKTFPYFQTAHLLFLKNQHNLKSIDFTENLKHSAAFISDRSLLYHLINRAEARLTEGIKEEDYSSRSTTDEIHVPVYQLADRNDAEPEEDTSPGLGKEAVTETSENVIQDSPVSISEKQDEEYRGSYSFTGWLAYLQEKKQGDSTYQPTDQSNTSQINLIDEFLKNTPSLKPDKAKMQDIVDISEKSVQPDDQLLSETLAGIYIQQGYFKKALRTYEKLSLKFPKKSTYFATRIEEIKAEMNKTKNS